MTENKDDHPLRRLTAIALMGFIALTLSCFTACSGSGSSSSSSSSSSLSKDEQRRRDAEDAASHWHYDRNGHQYYSK